MTAKKNPPCNPNLTTQRPFPLNNMIPVNEKEAIVVDIKNSEYKDYFNREIIYLRKEKVKEELLRKVDNIFKVLENPSNIDYIFFKNLCCDFKMLEDKCIKFRKKIKFN